MKKIQNFNNNNVSIGINITIKKTQFFSWLIIVSNVYDVCHLFQ